MTFTINELYAVNGFMTVATSEPARHFACALGWPRSVSGKLQAREEAAPRILFRRKRSDRSWPRSEGVHRRCGLDKGVALMMIGLEAEV